MIVSSRASKIPSSFKSAHFKSPGNRSNLAASSASAVPQVPSLLYPQKEPIDSPTRRILVCPKNQGPGKMSSLFTPSFRTLLRLAAQLILLLQLKSTLSMLTEFTINSKPLFSTEPIFWVTVLRPVDHGIGALNKRSFVFL